MPLHDTNVLSDVAAIANITVMRHSNWVRRFQIKNKRTRVAEDLTSSTFLGEIRLPPVSPTVNGALVKSFTFAVVVGSPTYFDVSLAIEDIDGLTTGIEYHFDWYRIVGTIPKKMLKGILTVEQGQTLIP